MRAGAQGARTGFFAEFLQRRSEQRLRKSWIAVPRSTRAPTFACAQNTWLVSCAQTRVRSAGDAEFVSAHELVAAFGGAPNLLALRVKALIPRAQEFLP